MMIGDLAIKWEDTGRAVPDYVATGIKKIIKKRLEEFGYRGIWIANPTRKRGVACKPFEYKRLGQVGAGAAAKSFIKAFCRPKDKDSCWEVAIYPPSDYDIGDIDINLSGIKPEAPAKKKAPEPSETPKTPKTPKEPSKVAIGQVFKATVTGRTRFGLLAEISTGVESYHLQGLIPLEHLGEQYDADNLNAYKDGQSIKVQVVAVTPIVKFSPEGAKYVTETDSVSDTFNGSCDTDGMLKLKGYSTSIERRRQLLLWLRDLARDFYPDPIPRGQAVDEVYLNLLEKYNATQAPRRVVARLVQALEYKHWVFITGGKDIGITDDGWIELGGKPQKGGVTPDMPVPATEVDLGPEEPEPEPEPQEVTKAVKDDFSLADYVRKTRRLTKIIMEMDALLAEKGGIEGWLADHYDEIDGMAKQLV